MERGGELIRENEERIFVSVRLRPLNDKEISRNDVSNWECIGRDTISYKNSTLPTSHNSIAYTFDRVFGSDVSTRTVYEEGAKDAAVSVVRGVNSTVVAYGETGSGKTYTITGITEYAVADIYDYIQKHPEREFVVKFSAMEIYNESIRDLLSSDRTPLKLLDDPERGTVVENLTEETLRDRDHVTELLFICEAQRQTSLNELSPKYHQITRLTIQSSPREYLGWDSPSTLTAAVYFVDLAGSERASQSLSAGPRLKDGQIDHSLQALGTVIRRLSKGRNENIPYRDSKLTRILQTSLGGNSRTAILCTMSPAGSHVEQSRNTLDFASCAKDVPTYARVNAVKSDAALVKHLQKELARLENELKSSLPKFTQGSFSALLREKDTQIDKLEKEVRDLILQRDIFQSQVKELLKMLGDTASSITQAGVGNYPNLRVRRTPDRHIQEQDPQFSDVETCDGLSRSNSGYRTLKVVYLDLEQSNASPSVILSGPSFNEDSFYGWHEIEKQNPSSLEDVCREVNCRDKEHCGHRDTATDYLYFQKNVRIPAVRVHVNGNEQAALDNDQALMPSFFKEDNETQEEIPLRVLPFEDGQEGTSEVVVKGQESTSTMPTEEGSHSSIQYPDHSYVQNSPSSHDQAKISLGSRGFNSWDSSLISWSNMMDYTPPTASEKECSNSTQNRADMEAATLPDKTSNADSKEKVDPASEKVTTKEKESVSEPNEQAEKDVKELSLEPIADRDIGLASWPVEFKRLQREIIEIWHACHVSLVHRTYFFILFQGDPTDAIYLEVEIRRMKLLKGKLSRGEKIVIDGQRITLSSSAKTLRQERRMLSEQMMKKLTEQERDSLFVEWGIDLNTKLRRLQLANIVWSKPDDINHITESANLVAKLVGFLDPGQTPSKEAFGMNLTPKYSTGICTYKRSLGSLL